MRSKSSSKLSITFCFIALLMGLWGNANAAIGLTSAESQEDKLPNFSVPMLTNQQQEFSNKAMLGKVSLLNIWASWCGYCRQEHSLLMKIKNDYHVPIFGLNYRDDSESANTWLNENGNPYILCGIDTEGTVVSDIGIYVTPETYIVDKHGNIRYRFRGAMDENDWKNDLWPKIQKYMKEK